MERKKCPFYGFYLNERIMDDSRGNQCALIVGVHAPCQMEVKGYEPNWNECDLNIERVREKIEKLSSIPTFPREFDDGEEWYPIRLRDWIDYIMEERH